MEHMRQAAFATVLRACGFGSLAIFCVMIGLSFEPRAAFQAGGFLTTLMAGILMFDQELSQNRDVALPGRRGPSTGGLCPVGEFDRAARDLSHLREVDVLDCYCHVVLGAGVLAPRLVTVIPWCYSLARSRRRGGPSAINGRLTIARPSANTGIMSRKIVQGVIGRSLQCSSLIRPGFDRRLIDRERSESRGHQQG